MNAKSLQELSPVLVVGGAGFVGGHLVRELRAGGAQVVLTKLEQEVFDAPGVQVEDLDIENEGQVRALLGKYRPGAVVHLAAQSSVRVSWEKPGRTMGINLGGTLALLEGARAECPRARIMLIGSSEEYGRASGVTAYGETLPLDPVNPYAVSKAAQTMLARVWARAYGLDIVLMRPFNHIGPGQRPGFAAADFCARIVQIENGEAPPVLRVGNLDAVRDFSDVRDIVRGYALLLRAGRPGEVYNIGSGVGVSIREILEGLLRLARVPIRVETDPALFRPAETAVQLADISKIEKEVGYRPQIPLEQTLSDMLDSFRAGR